MFAINKNDFFILVFEQQEMGNFIQNWNCKKGRKEKVERKVLFWQSISEFLCLIGKRWGQMHWRKCWVSGYKFRQNVDELWKEILREEIWRKVCEIFWKGVGIDDIRFIFLSLLERECLSKLEEKLVKNWILDDFVVETEQKSWEFLKM